MIFKLFVGMVITLISQQIFCDHKNDPLLTNPILKGTDGLLITKIHIENMLWLIKEIKNVHGGSFKLNDAGEPDPLKTGKHHDIVFRGKKQTMSALVTLEAQSSLFSHAEKTEFTRLFHQVKDYAEKVNNVLLDDARGTHEFMMELIKEWCVKYQRPDSELLKWDKGTETDHYRRTVTTFKKLQIFSSDLMNFLACLIKSCPIALKSYMDGKAARGNHQAEQK